MIATTIEQSKHLLELGLDSSTADMCWVKDYTGQWVLITDTQINIRSRLEGMYEYSGFQWQEHIAIIPAWSLSALLEVMPSNIGDYDLYITKHKYVDGGYGYNVEYNRGFTISVLHKATNRDLVTATYEMVCWLLKQGLIKKGDNNESKV